VGKWVCRSSAKRGQVLTLCIVDGSLPHERVCQVAVRLAEVRFDLDRLAILSDGIGDAATIG
jgi:hypothetical protein